MAGIPPSSSPPEPLAIVCELAEAGANQRGTSFVGSSLRLFEGWSVDELPHGDASTAVAVSPFDLGRSYELALRPIERRRTGSHLTPEPIARNLVALQPVPARDARVLDPAVGGAAFLLAVADRLVEVGAEPASVVTQLFGVDIDPGAIAVAEAAIALWGLDHGLVPTELANLTVGDGLLSNLPKADHVVGNPPFLNQLRSSSSHTAERRSALRERWGDLVTAYTDDAWLFVAAGLDALEADGSLAMVQPVSILAARHAHAVRNHVCSTAKLTALWVGREQVFDAAVQVCGVVVERGPCAAPDDTLQRRIGAEFEPVPALGSLPDSSQWGSAAGTAFGIPDVQLTVRPRSTIGGLASVTAGFRDQFYGFVPFVSEAPEVAADSAAIVDARLVTVGMIDPLGLSWGTRPFKFAKQEFTRPVVDVAALRRDDPRLAEWVEQRRRPKLLMATQTRVVEVWVDEAGSAIPATPVLSIEPQDAADLWLLAAAMSAPAVSAWARAKTFGTALSLTSMKLAARDVLGLALPKHEAPWREAALLIQHDPQDRARFAELMGQAYGTTDRSLAVWWLDLVGHTAPSAG